MKILIVCSANSGQVAPFIQEQVDSLERAGMKLEYFLIEGKGWIGYLKNQKKLKAKIKLFQPDIIHAHYGLSGLLANLQRRVPVVTTYHGSDINNVKVFPLSWIAMMLSSHNIFVSERNRKKSGLKHKQSLIPCGVDIYLFSPYNKQKARLDLGLDLNKKFILFAAAFDNKVKNSELAINAVALHPEANLLELKGFTREQVVLLMNAVDVALMTSFTEGSPQFIKEVMACNCPIVSVPVGDVPEVVADIKGCFISTYETSDVAEKLKQALDFGKRTDGRKRIIELGLDAESVALRVIEVYRNL